MKPLFIISVWLMLLLSFCLPDKRPLRVFMAGDSTMQPYNPSRTPQRGWGQVLSGFFDAKTTMIINKARGGRSTKSFIAEGLWQKLVDSLRPGDYVLIEFGHNDASKNKPERYTPLDQYEANLERMVKAVRHKRAVPVLLTPIARRSFDKEGHFRVSHGQYPARVFKVGHRLKVPVFDLNRLFGAVIKEKGSEASKLYFMHFGPGLYDSFPEGHKDDTHLREAGAMKVATLFVEALENNHNDELARLRNHLMAHIDD